MVSHNELPEVIKPLLMYSGSKFAYEVNRLRLPNGAVGDYGAIRHPGGALVVPVTNEGQLVVVRQYRFALQGRIIEFPAGTIETEEDPLSTVQRELPEEAGYGAKNWRSLGKFPLCPGYSDEWIYAFLATDLEKLATPPAQDVDEDIEVLLLSPEELEAKIHNGDRLDAKTIASYYLAKPFLTH
ncbi:NUDIX hydrolase [Picosynechococcus sp. PCC 11901]|uniref:NUDIX hydrolase n=1 Tax=unclassified Picosynechococcus TaxID=3079910 RepID=UPI0008109AC1|nr:MULTISPECIES: NUDIX hydrolase [unclassified Picosynechococcus]ANV86106.1 NUDIX hydrolase [Picosynechococcus sp. PCC 7117]QCS48783.1 NUDIX hydrolase [Picosynechococcus sp. PCC 11901]